MGDSSTSWVSTEPSTRVLRERESVSHPKPLEDPQVTKIEEEGTFARLVPQNAYARQAFKRLAEEARREDPIYQHHAQFLHIDERRDIDPFEREDCFIFSLGKLPEFPTIGWKIGKGRPNRPNLLVDICIHEGEGVAGVHARFCWVKGGGGFFLVADNLREVPVRMNGEVLKRTQRLIPYRNSISLGECDFSLQFQERSPEQEEQFQVELSAFYLKVCQILLIFLDFSTFREISFCSLYLTILRAVAPFHFRKRVGLFLRYKSKTIAFILRERLKEFIPDSRIFSNVLGE